MSDEIKIDSEVALAEHIVDLRKQWLESKYLMVTVRTGKRRTLTQNRALHLFCTMLADTLNAHGLDMRRTLKKDIDIPWSGHSAKEHLWRPIQEAVIGKISTVDADRREYSQVYEIMARHMAQKHGIAIPEWPRKLER